MTSDSGVGATTILLPVITVASQSVVENSTLAASSLIASVTDPNGFAITYYDFRDDGGTGGYFTLNGTREADGSWITITAAQLSQLVYVGGSSAGGESVDVAAWDGDNWSYYQTATVTTKAASLPVISVQNQSVVENASVAASSLIASVSDPNGYPITYYDFRDDGGAGGYFTLNGVKQADNVFITVSAAQLSQLQYVGGSAAGSEQVDVAASDAVNWSYYQTATVTTKAAALPVVALQNESVNQNASIAASSFIASVSDPNGYPITYYDFRDDGGSGGYFTLNGVKQANGVFITITAAQLSQLQYVGGSSAGSESIDVAAWDGYNWSYYQTATATTNAPSLPVIAVQNETVSANASIAASTFITSVSDPNRNAITYYDFRDDGGSGGYLTLNGVKQTDGNWVTITAAQLAQLVYVGGPAAGSESVDVAAWDGFNWSYFQTATATTKAAALPVITVQNQSVDEGASIAASSLIASVTDPSGNSITYYDFRDDGGAGGYFSLNGVKQADNVFITVSAANLSQLVYFGGASTGNDSVDVAAYDGVNWSYYQTAVVTTTAAVPSTVTLNEETVSPGATIGAASLILLISDPNNYATTAYQFRDDGNSGGYFTLNGVKQAANTWIDVTATSLSQLSYVGAASAGTDTIDVEVYNGHVWSADTTTAIITKSANITNAPVLTVNSPTVTIDQSIQAASLIASFTDPNKLTASVYDFDDQGKDGGYLILGGIRQVSGTVITVSAAQLSQLLYVGGTAAGTDTVSVAASDGQVWSNTAVSSITTQVATVARPVLVAQNQTVATNNSIQASSLIASVTDPNGLAISSYDFRDDGGSGGYLSLSGTKEQSGNWITVSAAALSNLAFVGASAAGTETVDVAAWDGVNWSYLQTVTVTTQSASPPVLTVQNETVNTGATLQGSLLIRSVSDPAGNPITSYQFRDDGGDGGYFTLNGAKQADGTWITVNASSLSQLVYTGGPSAGVEQVDVTATDGHLTSSYVTATITTQGTISTNPVIALLVSPGIKADATKYIVSGSLSYSGMLAILDDVAALGTVTQQEFTDLKTLVSYFNKTNGIQVSSYVAYISNALVNGDAANATWTGGTTSFVTLGNLAAGSTQTHLNELIGKWFLGTDLPAPIFGDTADSPVSSLITGVYFNDTNPLYNSTGAPSAADINQGYLGDCYFLASLAEAAQDDPAVIESMITTNGNGTYGVRFYVSGQPVCVTVNTELPLYPNSTYYIGNSSSDLWASLAEKAFVELNADPGDTIDHPTGNEYLLIGGGNADPITQITGKQVIYYDTGSYTATTWANLKSTIVAAIQSGEEVDYASSGATNVVSGQSTFIASHMFSGIGYDSTTGDFILRNPWGVSQSSSQSWMTQFEVSISQLFTNDAGNGGGYLAVAQGTVTAGFGAALPATATQLTLTGTVANQSTTDTSSLSPFSNVAVNDQSTGATDTITVTLSASANGALANLGGGTYNAATGVYTDTGSATAVTAALDGLVFIPTSHQAPTGQVVATGFTIGVSDTAGQSVNDSTTTVITTESAISGLIGTLGVSQQLELIYIAYFNRAADEAGYTYWEQQNVNAQNLGQSATTALNGIANAFAPQAETVALYPFLGGTNLNLTTPTAQAGLNTLVSSLYENMFDRPVDSAGQAYWVGQITTGAVAIGAAALAIANGATDADATEVQNKITVALDFTTRTGTAGLGTASSLPARFLTAARSVLSGVNGTSLNDASVMAGENATTAYISTAGELITTGEATTSATDPSVITVTGSNQLINPGAGSFTIRFLAGATADTLTLHAGGVDQVSGFDLTTDVLDLRTLLSEAGINLNGDLTALGKYVTITDQGSDAVVGFAPTGQSGASGTIAVLQGLGGTETALDTLVGRGTIRIA